ARRYSAERRGARLLGGGGKHWGRDGSAVEIRSLQHADLPCGWPRCREQAEGRRLRAGADREAVRFKTDRRPGTLSLSLSAGTGLVSPPDAGNRERRSDQGDLLHPDRGSV